MITLGDDILAANKRAVPKDDFRSNSHQNGVLVKNTEKHDPSEAEKELAIEKKNNSWFSFICCI
jgi:glutathione synthase/RimK-type ligase-like ATP-grasp enzyme